MSCASAKKLAKNIDYPCTKTPTPGVRATITVGYLSDITSIARKGPAGTADYKIITGIQLVSNAKLYTIEGYKLSNVSTETVNVTTYANFVPHNFQFGIFDRSANGRFAVDNLINTEDLFVISREKAVAGYYNVHGINTGMSCTGMNSDLNNENGGAYIMDFSAPFETGVAEILQKMNADGVTDDTKTYLEGLTFKPA